MIAKARFLITLEGAADANSANIRTLKQLLKRLLRSPAALRCTNIRQIDDRRDDDGDEQ